MTMSPLFSLTTKEHSLVYPQNVLGHNSSVYGIFEKMVCLKNVISPYVSSSLKIQSQLGCSQKSVG